ELVSRVFEKKPDRIIFVGSGNSWSTMYSGFYLISKFSSIPCYLFFGPELVSMKPKFITKNTVAILASYSGTTEDTLDAASFLKEYKCKTMSITNKSDSELARMTDYNINYDSKSLYISALFELYLFVLDFLNKNSEFNKYNEIEKELLELPLRLEKIVKDSEMPAKELASKVANSNMFYLCADGPLFGLGYQTAMTVFTEYLRMDAAILNGCEFRHGTLEIVGNGKPTIGFLLGNDDSRVYTERTFNFCEKYGARTFKFDLKENNYKTNPLLSPFYVFPKINWFILYMSVIRNIDLDEYIYMHVVDYH
ncbi:MAG: SIS domain-containing protein, partial [Actinobacteria bacterium]|nr:SIS domain-containing protein [Actinomycetota bacterium]